MTATTEKAATEKTAAITDICALLETYQDETDDRLALDTLAQARALIIAHDVHAIDLPDLGSDEIEALLEDLDGNEED